MNESPKAFKELQQSLLELQIRTQSILTPPQQLSISEWSEKYRILSKEYSANQERFKLKRAPWAKEPMDACQESDVNEVVLWFARQMIKTTIEENIMFYHMQCDPAPMLYVRPSDIDVEAYSTERLTPAIRDNPIIRDLIGDSSWRVATNTIKVKTFPGGSLALVGANSPAGLSARSRRLVFFDEIDKFPKSAGVEGDPIAIATKTTETFPNACRFMSSTCTIKNFSRIEFAYEQTDKRKWFVKCPHCHQEQILEWPYVRFPSGSVSAHIVCRFDTCGKPWTEVERQEAVLGGRWVATAPFNGKRGYWINGIYSLFPAKKGFKTRLHQAVEEFFEATGALKKGNPELMKTWVNGYKAETYEESMDKLDAVTIAERAEEYTPQTLPVGALVVGAGADVQKDRIELEWQALGLDDESWGISHEIVYGNTREPMVWRQLSQRLAVRFKRLDGVELVPAIFAIDTHFLPKETREWIRHHGVNGLTVVSVLGSSFDMVTLVSSKFSKQDGMTTHSIDTVQAKNMIFGRLRIDRPENWKDEPIPRYMHLPRGNGYTEDWYAQLTAEKVATRYLNGFPKKVYVKEDNARNEALDMRVYAMGAFEILRPNLQIISDLLKVEAEKKKKGGPPATPPPQKKMSIGSSFIGGAGFQIGNGAKFKI